MQKPNKGTIIVLLASEPGFRRKYTEIIAKYGGPDHEKEFIGHCGSRPGLLVVLIPEPTPDTDF